MSRRVFRRNAAGLVRPAIYALAVGLAAALFMGRGEAQQIFNLTPDQIQQMQQNGGVPVAGAGSGVGAGQAPSQQQSVVLQPAVPPQAPVDVQPSRLEQIMSARAGVVLKQFGYDQAGRAAAVIVPQTGALQDDYILGAGDEIVVVLRGQENNEIHTTVDRNGQAILPRLGPISAGGRSLGSFRQDLQAAVRRAYVATEASVSVARLRQISVLVTGAVNNPGQRLVTGLSSAFDAILISGGIAKTGSLRDIRILRAGRQYTIDLYGLLTGGSAPASMRLADGDRIFVAPLGRTVAAAGLVRNPGIYELPPGQTAISAQALITLAGGREVNGNYFYSLLKLQPDGRTVLTQLKNTSEMVSDGEILQLQFQADQTAARASLAGGTGLAGNYPLTSATKLSDIIRLPGALGASPYTLLGLIARRDPNTLLRTLVAFTPVAVLHGKEDMPLEADDIVRVISVDEMHMMIAAVHDYDQARQVREDALHNPGSINNLGTATDTAAAEQNTVQSLVNRPPNRVSVSGQSGAAVTPALNPAQNPLPGAAPQPVPPPTLAPNFQNQTSAPGTYQQNREAVTFAQLAQQLNVDPLVLTNFLLDHTITLDGAVRGPGTYFGGPSATLQDIVSAAGGTMNWADASGVELITTIVDPNTGHSASRVTKLALNAGTMAGYVVQPHDAFRFNQILTDVDIGSVTVQGEVRFAGNFKLTRGEHLSDLLARAGGLTNAAYPYGTVFLRRSVAAKEAEGYQRAAKDIEDQLVDATTRVGNNKLDPGAFAALQTFVNDLRNQRPLGRISISADPSVLASNPALDPLLETGDVIYIPPRPSTISVLGQVMQPGNFPYQARLSATDYIRQAGGYSSLADQSEVYVVLPDGTARKLEQSWLRFSAGTTLPPGSAIVIPRDVLPFDLRQTIMDVTQIMSQLAVTIASVAVISK